MEGIIKGEIPFVRILIPFTSGISLAYLSMPVIFLKPAICLGSLMWLLLVYSVIFYKKHYNYHFRWVNGLILNILLCTGGYVLTSYQSQKFDAYHFSKGKYEMLFAAIQSEPVSSGGIIRFETIVSQSLSKDQFYPSSGKLLIAVKADNVLNYRYGDMIMIPARYNEVPAPLNPGEFDYRAYLANHKIYHQTFINEKQIRLVEHGHGNPIAAYAFKLRKKLVSKFAGYISDRNASSVASTLILGYRSNLSREVLDAYSKTGTMHVLSVSGMHVGIVFMMMMFLLQFMEHSKRLRIIRAVLMIVLIWFYAVITGFSPSVCRSAMMISFVIIGKAISRDLNTYNLLAISAVLLLIYDPFFLFDVGFQLSYLSVLGLVYLYPKLYRLLYIENWLGDKVWSYIALSTAAQLATFPLSIYYFHQFPVYFLASNIFIILPVTFIMYAGLLFLFIPWDVLLEPLGWLLNKSIILMNEGLFFIEHLPFANVEGIWIDALTYLMIYPLILTMIFAFLDRKKILIYSALLVLFILITKGSLNRIKQQDLNRIVFYSLRKNPGIGFFEGQNAFVITDLEKEDKAWSYGIKPSIESAGMKNVRVVKPGLTFSQRNFFYNKNFVQFRKLRLLLWDKTFNRKIFPNRVSVDILLLQGNPGVTLKSLLQSVRFKTLLIDATNPDYKIRNWEKEAKEYGIECYVLKGNPAYVIEI